MKTTLQIIFAAYLFSKGFRKANAIAEALHIHPIFICRWAKSPFWRFAIRFWGYTGNEKVTGTATWEKKQIAKLQEERLNKVKNEIARHTGAMNNDLITAERLWRRLIENGADLFPATLHGVVGNLKNGDVLPEHQIGIEETNDE